MFGYRFILLCLIGLLGGSVSLQASDIEQRIRENAPGLDTLSIRSLTMREMAELMTHGCKIPVVVSVGAADVEVEAYLENVNALDALQTVCRINGLWYRLQENGIIEVMTLEEYRDGATVYQEDYVEVITVLYPAAKDIGETLYDLYPDRVIWTKPDEETGDRYEDIQKALDRMDQLARRAQFSLSGSFGGGGRDSGDDDDDDDDDDDNHQSPFSQDQWQQKYKNALLDKVSGSKLASMQDEGKGSLWEASGELGFVYVSAFPGPNQLVLRSSDIRAIQQIKEVVKKLDTVTPQVLLEVKVLEVSLGDEHDVGIDWLFAQDYDDPNIELSGGFANGFPGGGGGNKILGANALLQPQGTGLDPRAFVFNFISEDVRARLNLLEKQGRVTQLATPSLMVADSEASMVFIGTELTILESIKSTTTYDQNNTRQVSYDVETERRNVGDTLLLTPKLHADRTVTLRVLQENSQLGNQRPYTYGDEEKLITQDIDKRTVASTVVAGDGTMVALGGLIREKVSKDVEGIPFLMNLPLIGTLFKRTVDERDRSELMVIIRPFILVAPGETDQVSHDFLERISQHPSAKDDIPALGVSDIDDVARPEVIDPEDSLYDRVKSSARVWSIEP